MYKIQDIRLKTSTSQNVSKLLQQFGIEIPKSEMQKNWRLACHRLRFWDQACAEKYSDFEKPVLTTDVTALIQ